MFAKCPKCNHEWDYKGKSKYYLTCPQCYKKVKVDQAVIVPAKKKEK